MITQAFPVCEITKMLLHEGTDASSLEVLNVVVMVVAGAVSHMSAQYLLLLTGSPPALYIKSKLCVGVM